MLLFAEERLPAIPSGDHEDEDDDGVDDDKYGDDRSAFTLDYQ